MAFTRRIVNGVFWSSASNWGRQAVSLVILLVLARVLAVQDFGLFALALMVATALQILVTDGVAEAVVQRAELRPGHLDTAFWMNGALGCLLAGLLCLCADPVARLFGEADMAGILRALSGCLVIGGFSAVFQAVLRRDLEYRLLAIRSFAGVAAGGLVGIGMAFSGAGVWSLVGQQYAEFTVGLAVLVARSGWRPRLHWSLAMSRDLIGYTVSISVSRLLMFWYGQTDRLLVGLILGPLAVGIYSLGQRILGTLQSVVTDGVSMVAFAAFCRLQDDPVATRNLFYGLVESTSLVVFPAFVGASVVAPDLVPLLFGEKWAESGDVLRILVLTGLPWWLHCFTAAVVRAAGRPNLYLAMILLSLCTSLVAVLATVRFGVEAVAAGVTVGTALIVPFYIRILHGLLGVGLAALAVRIAPALAGCLTMAAAIEGLRPFLAGHMAPVLVQGCLVATGAVVYGGVVLLACRKRIPAALAFVRSARHAGQDGLGQGLDGVEAGRGLP